MTYWICDTCDDNAKTPKEIAEEISKPVNAVRKPLAKLLDTGQKGVRTR